MSLTSELESAKSWVNHFFKECIPHVIDFARCKGSEVKSMDLVVPSNSAKTARLVGTAFDYRLRMHFDADFAGSDVIVQGIERLGWIGSGLGQAVDEVWSYTTEELLREFPSDDNELMARASVVLAWLDWGYRSFGIWSSGLRAIAETTHRTDLPDWASYTAPIEEGVVTEVAALMTIANPPLAELVVCGTSFGGSTFVGGADSDLILDGCLYDVKTTLRPRRGLTPMIRELLGYVLLDWDDEFGLDRVGFYWSRQGRWMSWDMATVLEHSTRSTMPMYGLREEFKRRARERTTSLLQP